MYDYFYGQQAELFSFYRVPKVLFTDEKFSNISSDAKLLYGIMLDRMNLSAKNGWVDELGRVYIIFTIEEVKGALGCAEKKAVICSKCTVLMWSLIQRAVLSSNVAMPF